VSLTSQVLVCRFQRRSKSSADKDYVAKRRSYVIDKDDSDTKDRGSKKGSYTLDHSVDTEPKYRQDRKPKHCVLNNLMDFSEKTKSIELN
jgi:hypothetical protein